jgi:hypothetical protein
MDQLINIILSEPIGTIAILASIFTVPIAWFVIKIWTERDFPDDKDE